MPDLGSISTAIATIKTSMDIAKLIKDSSSSLDEAETKLKLAELISTLADLKTELADIKVDLIDKDEIIRELKNKIQEKESLSFDGKLYWKEGDKIPFCPICFENENKYIHLTHNEGYPASIEYSGEEPFYICKVCDKIY
jgi:hypothetical protein